MVYLGSKTRIRKYILPILQNFIIQNNIKNYIEPFVGGANIISYINCENKEGYDKSDTLIALLNQAKEDPSKIPTNIDREIWDKAKAYAKEGIQYEDLSLYEIGAVEFLASYASRGFAGGMINFVKNRNCIQERYNNLLKQSSTFKNIKFYCSDYKDILIPENSLVYCDPPYINKKQYGYKKTHWNNNNYKEFYEWLQEISKYCYVFLSESTPPPINYEIVWNGSVLAKTEVHNTKVQNEFLFYISNKT